MSGVGYVAVGERTSVIGQAMLRSMPSEARRICASIEKANFNREAQPVHPNCLAQHLPPIIGSMR